MEFDSEDQVLLGLKIGSQKQNCFSLKHLESRSFITSSQSEPFTPHVSPSPLLDTLHLITLFPTKYLPCLPCQTDWLNNIKPTADTFNKFHLVITARYKTRIDGGHYVCGCGCCLLLTIVAD